MISPTDPRRHVVAVFGGNGVPPGVAATARRVARHVVARGAAVLSGGDGSGARRRARHAGSGARRLDVKDEANAAARAGGAWVSVLNSTRESRGCVLEGEGIVVRPEIGDQRNLLEAYLSDACVVLAEGAGEGTLSELVSALCLGRPVLLIGGSRARGTSAEWSSVRDAFSSGAFDASTARAVVDRARDRLGSDAGPLAHLVTTRITAANLRLSPACAALAPTDDPGTTTWLDARMWDEPIGGFPELAALEPELGPARSRYEAWLDSPPRR